MTAAIQSDISTGTMPVPVLAPASVHTPDDVIRLENEGLFELVDGRLLEKTMGARSNQVAGKFTSALVNWTDRHGGYVLPETSFQCFPDRSPRTRRPDVAVVLAGRFAGEALPEGHLKIRPDLAIEVVSKNDLVEELNTKLRDYVRAEIPLVWVVYPNTATIEVRPLGGPITILQREDMLTGDPILPGFRVAIADLLPPPVEGTNSDPDLTAKARDA